MFTIYLHAYIETKPRVNSFIEQSNKQKSINMKSAWLQFR